MAGRGLLKAQSQNVKVTGTIDFAQLCFGADFLWFLSTLGQEGHNHKNSYNHSSCVCLVARVFFGGVFVIVYSLFLLIVFVGISPGVFRENRDGRQMAAEGSIAQC